MNRFFFWVAIAYFIVAPIRLIYCAHEDIFQAESWADLLVIPFFYVPTAAAVALVAFLLWLRIHAPERKGP